MGSGSWTSKDWGTYTASRGYTATSTARDFYKSSSMKDDFNPKGIKFRESCDSDEHPNSTPIILGLDVTGSMSSVLEIVSKKLNTLITEIFERKPVEDPQIMFAAFGDAVYDDSPLQVTQFESDIRIAEQLNDIYFERGGGGNGGESYALPWYFAARHTKIDSYDKHGKKGFLFTIGDECCLPTLTKDQIKEFIGDDVQADISAEEILTEVSRKYEVYHLIVDPVCYQNPEAEWKILLGKNCINVEEIDKIPEIIVSILELHAGKTAEEVADSWDGSTSVVVKNAIKDLAVTGTGNSLIEF